MSRTKRGAATPRAAGGKTELRALLERVRARSAAVRRSRGPLRRYSITLALLPAEDGDGR